MSLDVFEYQNDLTLIPIGSLTEDSVLVMQLQGNSQRFQSITPQIYHEISQIKIMACRVGSPGTLYIDIKATDDDGHPTGSVLTSGSINANTFTTDFDCEEYGIDISSYNLTKGAKYSFVIRVPDGDYTNLVAIRCINKTEMYPMGKSGVSSDGGNSWGTYGWVELWFEVYGTENTISVTTHSPFNVTNNMMVMRGQITSEHEWDLEAWFDYRISDGEWRSTDRIITDAGHFYYAVRALEPGQTYECIAKVSHAGKYAGSNIYSGGTETTDTCPRPPTNPEITAETTDSLSLEWVIGEGEEGEVYTVVRRRIDKPPTSPTDGTGVYNDTGNSFTDSGLTPGTKYYYSLWSYRSSYSISYATLSGITSSELIEPVDPVHTKILIDWNDDGDFGDESEEVTADNLSLSFNLGRNKEFEESQTGVIQFSLHNYHGKYTPENASSPLYGYVTIGKRIKIIAEYGTHVYPLFTGKITDINVHPHISQQSVFITCADGVHYLKGQRISTPYYKGTPAYEVINNILDDAKWDGPRKIMVDDALIFGTAWTDISAWDAIKEIEKALSGFFYVDRDGAAIWEGAYYRSLEIPRTEQATFNEIKDITYILSDKSIYNRIKVKYQERNLTDIPVCVAQYSHPEPLSQGKSFEVELTWEGWTEKITHISAHGYTSWGEQALPVEVLEESMNSVRIEVSYPESPEPPRATVKVEVYALMMEITECSQVREDEDSIADFGKQDKIYDVSLSAAGYQEAGLLADYALYRFKDSHPEITAFLNHPDNLEQLLQRDISDRVRVVSTALSIDKDYFIDSIEYNIDQAILHSARYSLSECDPQIFWKLGTDRLGVTTRLAI